MGQTSTIEWTDATWNPWQGCTKVSEACAHCYMFRDMARYGRDPNVVRRSAPATFNLPLKMRRDGQPAIEDGSKVFTCSWSDWFHRSADTWRPEAWQIVRKRPDVIFQIVTKRTDRILECLPPDWGDGYPNVWLIATTETQEWLEKRARELVKVPAAVHGLSCEPLLGPLNLTALDNGCGEQYDALRAEVYQPWQDNRFRTSNTHPIDWVIVGGESGPGSRPMHPQWVRSIRDQCHAAGTPFFFKQHGEWLPWDDASLYDRGAKPVHNFEDNRCVRVGKKAAGRLLDGVEHSEFPTPVPV